jgi:hypothetical protein
MAAFHPTIDVADNPIEIKAGIDFVFRARSRLSPVREVRGLAAVQQPTSKSPSRKSRVPDRHKPDVSLTLVSHSRSTDMQILHLIAAFGLRR